MCHFQLRYIIVLTEWKKYNIITYHQVLLWVSLCGSAEMETQHGSHSGRLEMQQQQQFDQSSCIRVHGAGSVHKLHPPPLASWLPSNQYCAGRGHLAKSFCTLQLGIASSQCVSFSGFQHATQSPLQYGLTPIGQPNSAFLD